MFPILLLTLVAVTGLANPTPRPEPFALAPVNHSSPPPSIPSRRGHSVALSHSKSYIKRARHVLRSRHRPRAHRNQPHPRDTLDPSWLLREAAKLDVRYNNGQGDYGSLLAKELGKRTGQVNLADHKLDTSYSGSVSIGTPAQTFDIVLDTGSSDLWIASSACTSQCSSMTTYDGSKSSTYVGLDTTFAIQYGSGNASGTLVQDEVNIGGYSVASQTFASCSSITSGLLSDSVSGIMGLSWQSLAYSKATPWWITLAESSAWSQPLFAFYLERYRDVSDATDNESNGGQATFGYLDSSMYTGSITYVSVPLNALYWQVPLDSMTIQGTSVPLASSNTVAIDTGTTLVGGPASIIASIYAAIPGSQQMTGSYNSYYEYPCSSNIDFEITIGGYTVKISDQDLNLGRYSSDPSMCTGAVYIQDLSGSPMQWIFGDTVLKNVYSVYRYNPPAVGFANLPSADTNTPANVSTTIPDVSTLEPVTPLTSASVNGTIAAITTTSATIPSPIPALTNTSNALVISASTSSIAVTAHVVTATSTVIKAAASGTLSTGSGPSPTSSVSSTEPRIARLSIMTLASLVMSSLLL